MVVEAEAPTNWPLEDIRLSLDLGGESLVDITYPDGSRDLFGLDPNHEEFPLNAHKLAINVEAVARKPFGQPVRDPRLNRAAFLRVDLALSKLTLLLTQVQEAAVALGEDEAVAPLIEAAEVALRGLDWPSHTPDYVARAASLPRSKTIWRLPPLEIRLPGIE